MLLKFEYFQSKDTAEILCDFWKLKYYHRIQCIIYNTYSIYCKAILSKRWDEKRGEFETVISSIKNLDPKYLVLINQTNSCETFDKLIKLISCNLI